jgi:ABC-type antimicrobial peptide transport system ATPase subunit
VTRKDSELIASVLRSVRGYVARATADRFALEFADELTATNQRFDRVRFLAGDAAVFVNVPRACADLTDRIIVRLHGGGR